MLSLGLALVDYSEEFQMFLNQSKVKQIENIPKQPNGGIPVHASDVTKEFEMIKTTVMGLRSEVQDIKAILNDRLPNGIRWQKLIKELREQ